MMTTILAFFKKIWLLWASLFNAMPYGDPYVAFTTLFMVFCVAVWLVQKILTRNRTRRSKRFDASFHTDEDRYKTYCKVMNIR